MQWKRIGVIALSVVLVVAPASAIPVTDPAAIAQRITMMANQVSIITNQLTQIQQFSDKLTEMRDQVQHLKDKALGAYHSLTSPFSSLISAKTELVGTGMSWIGDFQGRPTSSPIPTRTCPTAFPFEEGGTACSGRPIPSPRPTWWVSSSACRPGSAAAPATFSGSSESPPTAGGCSITPWPMLPAL